MALQNLCNLIWGMARLAEHPGPELMRRFLQKTEELLELSGFENEEDVGQGIANTLWALAVLDELRPDFVERVSAMVLGLMFWFQGLRAPCSPPSRQLVTPLPC